MKLPEEDLKKTEACRGLSRLYVTVYILILCICWCCLLNCSLLHDMNTVRVGHGIFIDLCKRQCLHCNRPRHDVDRHPVRSVSKDCLRIVVTGLKALF